MGNGHHHTPKKAKVLGTISFLGKEKIPYFKSREIVRQQRNRRNLQDDPDHPDLEETRGRKRILTPDDIHAMENLIWEYGFEARALSWQSLAYKASIIAEVSWRTIQRALGTLGYRKSTTKRRLEAITIALRERPTPEHWRDIRWSNEVHFSLGPKGRVMIIRKPELYFYEVLENTNGKMLIKVYRDEILNKVVGSWLTRGDQFVLEEDGDSGHGTGKKNINAVKQYIARFPTWTKEELRNLAVEAWNTLSQESINGWVDSMVQRMQDVVEREGKMTGH
ncbi:hypothetical protein C7999DRAFT_44998 [Corynascus novoguineensis]|uniref:Uncharacterized protein n=1 Tax=Corynascus novoguineensis TaxID=1126955 RepID=A0AAN7CJ92_9PEZI|nr:hypothetical protein C7999DRAFT_44998 [Corynascus novoguineensis]